MLQRYTRYNMVDDFTYNTVRLKLPKNIIKKINTAELDNSDIFICVLEHLSNLN